MKRSWGRILEGCCANINSRGFLSSCEPRCVHPSLIKDAAQIVSFRLIGGSLEKGLGCIKFACGGLTRIPDTVGSVDEVSGDWGVNCLFYRKGVSNGVCFIRCGMTYRVIDAEP